MVPVQSVNISVWRSKGVRGAKDGFFFQVRMSKIGTGTYLHVLYAACYTFPSFGSLHAESEGLRNPKRIKSGVTSLHFLLILKK
jgi:hypothetical protein